VAGSAPTRVLLAGLPGVAGSAPTRVQGAAPGVRLGGACWLQGARGNFTSARACAAGALALSQVAVAACACGAGVGGAVCRERGIGRAGPASWMAQGGLFSVRGLVAWRDGAVAVTACARAAGVGVAVYRERRIGVRIFVLFFFYFLAEACLPLRSFP